MGKSYLVLLVILVMVDQKAVRSILLLTILESVVHDECQRIAIDLLGLQLF